MNSTASDKTCVVLITCSARPEGEALARRLVDERLAACVNILGGVRSIYRWEGAVEEADEVLLICKTLLEIFPALEARVRESHAYSVPECIALPVETGSFPYLAWLAESVAANPS